MSLRQEYKKVLKLVEQDGRFTISKSKSNHYHVRSLEGELITVMSSTPSTLRALKNVQGVLRQHGVEILRGDLMIIITGTEPNELWIQGDLNQSLEIYGPIEHVLCASDGSAVRMVFRDGRWRFTYAYRTSSCRIEEDVVTIDAKVDWVFCAPSNIGSHFLRSRVESDLIRLP